MLRELEKSQLSLISGGLESESENHDIVAIGQRTSPTGAFSFNLLSFSYSGDTYSYSDSNYCSANSENDPEDSDGDGIPNWVEYPTVVTSIPLSEIRALEDKAETMTKWTEWYLTLSSAFVGSELSVFTRFMESAIGVKATALVIAVATKAGSDYSEEYMKDFWFNYEMYAEPTDIKYSSIYYP